MTEAERRGLRLVLVFLLVGQMLTAAQRRWPGLLPDVVRHAPHIESAEARPAPAAAAPHPPRAAHRTPAAAAPSQPCVDINRADAAAWCALPGIGAKKAAAILEERRRGGRFRSIQDLTRVRGIGPATVARLRPWLRCDPPIAPSSERVR